MRVLITFALANEFAPWRKLRRFECVSADAWDKTYTAQIGSADVRVVLTGAGRFSTQRWIEKAFRDLPDICIASGLCGSLKPDYNPGDILVARTVSDVRGTRLLNCDSELVSCAEGPRVNIVERFLVSDQVVSTAAEKQFLGVRGDAVDMESIYVLAAAAHRGVRSVAIRAVSDRAESDLPLDFDTVFNEKGAVSIPKVIGQVVRRPGRIAGLLRLANESERAAAALAQFLDSYIQSIGEGPFLENAKVEALAI